MDLDNFEQDTNYHHMNNILLVLLYMVHNNATKKVKLLEKEKKIEKIY